MSIEKMSLVTIRGERGQLDEVLLRCLDSGVFHPETAGSLSEYAAGLSALKEENPYAGLGKKLSAIAQEADIDLGNTSFEGLDLANKEFSGYIDGLDAKLILQVHDELIVEADAALEDRVKDLLREEMEQAASLRVPLEVDVHTGDTWYAAKG